MMKNEQRVKGIKFLRGVAPILFFLILISCVSADTGICELDKDHYHPGETAVFQCSCTAAQEENRAGFIVFVNDNGSILQSTPTNSLSCRTSLFGAGYTFQIGDNFTGNTTFSLNADGTGKPLNWGDAGDINFDIFNVSGAHETDCIITNVKVPPMINKGEENANVFQVLDAVTDAPIVGVSCVALAFDKDETPILIEPYGEPYKNYKTVTGGFGYLTSKFEEDKLETGETYEFDLLCQCDNLTDGFGVCFNDYTGERLGYRSCEITGLFTIDQDLTEGSTLIPFLLLTTIFVLMVIAYILKDASFTIISGIVMFLTGLYFLIEHVGDLTQRLRWGFGITFCLVGIYLIMACVLKLFAKPKEKEQFEVHIEENE